MRPTPFALALALCACRASSPSLSPRAPVDLRAGVDTRSLEQYLRTQRFTVGRPTSFAPTPDGRAVLYLRAPEQSAARALWRWDRDTRRARVLVTAEQLLGAGEEHLDAAERARRERTRTLGRGITQFALSPDGTRVLLSLSGSLFVVDAVTGTVRTLSSQRPAPVDARWSPDGRAVALVRNGELAMIDVETGTERALTQGADAHHTHAVAEFVAQEELDRMEGWWWSPDAREIAWQETDLTRVERLRIADPLHPETAPDESAYPRAGTENASIRLRVSPVAGGPVREITWDHARFPYLAAVRWARDTPLTLVVLDRAQRELAVLTANADGSTRTLLTERDAAWVNHDADNLVWLPGGRAFLWLTERNGAWQLARVDAADGSLTALTPPSLDLRGLAHVDTAHHTAHLLVGDADGATQCATFDYEHPDTAPTRTTRDDGDHRCVPSREGDLVVRETSTVSSLPTTTVHDATGAPLGTLEHTMEAPLALPRVTFVTVGDRGYRAAIVRPHDFDPTRRYPVIDSVYGGPGMRMVTRSLTRYLVPQWFADQGFVVVMIDGRGTPHRGRDWERALAGHLGDVPLDDQADALRALGARDPSLDLSRVGIMGWSFGGYLSARAVIERPETFHAAVSGAPVTEWREYDTAYTERYLGLPAERGDDYDRASLLPHAPTLSRPLLLVHGTADDNVYFHNALRLTEVLYRAGRRFEFLPLPGETHLVNEPSRALAWTLRARAFFVEHLQPAP